MTIRVLIVDDHHVVREGLRGFLRRDPELDIVDEAADGVEALEKARGLHPDVVLMDLLLPGMDGITATSVIRRELPETKVVALTSVLNSTSLTRAIRAGAHGYLLKDAHANELRTAIKAAARGQAHLSSQVSTALLNEVLSAQWTETLTKRELDVLQLLAKGLANKSIAQTLQIAEDTVRTHIRHILSKFGVQSRTQAVLVAIRLGLVTQDTRTC
jgi:two-component system, NarL family, response regulator LiaR